MRKLTLLTIAGLLFITTSAYALTDAKVKAYVEKHCAITQKLKTMKKLRLKRDKTIRDIRKAYKYDQMIAEIEAVRQLYNNDIETLTNEYNAFVGELENIQ